MKASSEAERVEVPFCIFLQCFPDNVDMMAALDFYFQVRLSSKRPSFLPLEVNACNVERLLHSVFCADTLVARSQQFR